MKKRLLKMSNWILAHKNINTVADIGTDHGHLPIYLAEQNKNLKIFATDISRKCIANLNLQVKWISNISLKTGFGFNPIPSENIDICVIAGMGQNKMLQILKLDDGNKKKYIFQLRENPLLIRKWIREKDYFVEKESIVYENNHYYHTMLVNKETGKPICDFIDETSGVILRSQKDDIFHKYWTEKLKFKENITKTILKNRKTAKIFEEINMIKKILNND